MSKAKKKQTTGLFPEITDRDVHDVRREQVLDQAVREHKITASRKPFYRRMYDRDAVGTQQLLAKLAPGLPGDEQRQAKGTGLISELRE